MVLLKPAVVAMDTIFQKADAEELTSRTRSTRTGLTMLASKAEATTFYVLWGRL